MAEKASAFSVPYLDHPLICSESIGTGPVRVLRREPRRKGPNVGGLLVCRRPVPREGSAFRAFWRRGKEMRRPGASPFDSLFRCLTRHPRTQPIRLRLGSRPQPSRALRGSGLHPLAG